MPDNNFLQKWDFEVQIDGITRAKFKSCSGLGFTVEEVSYSEGGNLLPHKRPGRMSTKNVTLARGLTKDEDIYRWAKNREVRNISIVQMDNGEPVARWFLEGAFVVDYSLDEWSDSSEVQMENIEVSYNDFDKEL